MQINGYIFVCAIDNMVCQKKNGHSDSFCSHIFINIISDHKTLLRLYIKLFCKRFAIIGIFKWSAYKKAGCFYALPFCAKMHIYQIFKKYYYCL